MKILLDDSKGYYKANLHCHTNLSDGRATPEDIKREYKARGYSVVAITDHEHLIDNSDLNDDEFITITSAELAVKEFPEQSTLKNYNMKVAHFNIYAKEPSNTLTPCYSKVADHYVTDLTRHRIKGDGDHVRVYTADYVNGMIKLAHERGFLIAYNHPSWSLETAVDYLKYDGFDFVEIHNTSCVKAGHPDDESVFADMLRAGKKIYCTAADDNHNRYGFDEPYTESFGGWVMINAERLGYKEIIEALESGNFYASTGPKIYSMTQDGDTVRIKTSPVKAINAKTRGRHMYKLFAAPGEYLTEAEFKFCEMDDFFRIVATDEYGKRAFTQAYDIEV